MCFSPAVGWVVSEYRGVEVELKGSHGLRWRIGGLNDTVFRYNPRMMEEWERSFLPSPVKMEVIGLIDHFCVSGNRQWRYFINLERVRSVTAIYLTK